MKQRIFLFAILIAAVFALPASAEVEKFIRTCDGGKLCPYYRLKFTPPAGWVQDMEATKKNGLPMYVRKGKDFASSPALMYITVSYNHDKRSVQQFVDTAHEYWRGKVKDTKIEKMAVEKRANGMPDFQVYHYVNPSQPQQAYELLAYGEDKDKDGNTFLTKIALTAASQKALEAAETDYRAGLRAH